MDENLEGMQRPIYHNVWMYWLMQLIMLVLIPFNGVLFSIIALAANIVQLYEVYAMRDVSDGMARAWRWKIVSIALMIGGMVLVLLALGSILGLFLALLTVAGAVGMLVADYYFFAGLDGLILPRGYDYPTGRIRWCFWLQLISNIAVMLVGNLIPFLGALIQLVLMAVILWLLWQYLQAVKEKEGV